MEIVLLSPHLETYGPSSETGAAARALAHALKRLDHTVTVLSPLYRSIEPSAKGLARRLNKIDVELGEETFSCELYDGRTPGGVDVLFVGHEKLFDDSASFAEAQGPANLALRTGVFAHAAEQVLKARERRADVLHAFDWFGAAPLVLGELGEVSPQFVLTVVDPASQGRFDRELAALLGPVDAAARAALEHGKELNVLKAALLHATRVTLSSSGLARELTTAPHGRGLEEVFGSISSKVLGTPLGIDTSIWNPAIDSHLPMRFDHFNLRGKATCKAQLQQRASLPIRSDAPLVGASFLGEGAHALPLLLQAAPQLLRNDLQLIALIDGRDETRRAELDELAARWPDRLHVLRDETAEAEHQILGASDLWLTTCREGVCASQQVKRAQTYASVPLAVDEPALSDFAINCDSRLETGTAFLHSQWNAEGWVAAVQRAASHFATPAFQGLTQRVAEIEHSWERTARILDGLYREISAE